MKNLRNLLIVLASIVVLLMMTLSSGTVEANWSASGNYSPSNAYIGDSVDFQFTVTNTATHSVDLSSATVSVNWGSTSTDLGLSGTTSISPGGSTTLSASFTVPQVSEGTYVAHVVIKGKATGDLLTSTFSFDCNLAVTNVPALHVSVQSDTTSGKAPLSTTLTSTVTGGEGPYSYSWTLGDGSTSDAIDVSHTYASQGDFTAKLTVTDSRNNQASDTVVISVQSGGIVDVGGSSALGTIALIVVALVIVALVAAVVLLKKKNKIPPGGNPPSK